MELRWYKKADGNKTLQYLQPQNAWLSHWKDIPIVEEPEPECEVKIQEKVTSEKLNKYGVEGYCTKAGYIVYPNVKSTRPINVGIFYVTLWAKNINDILSHLHFEYSKIRFELLIEKAEEVPEVKKSDKEILTKGYDVDRDSVDKKQAWIDFCVKATKGAIVNEKYDSNSCTITYFTNKVETSPSEATIQYAGGIGTLFKAEALRDFTACGGMKIKKGPFRFRATDLSLAKCYYGEDLVKNIEEVKPIEK